MNHSPDSTTRFVKVFALATALGALTWATTTVGVHAAHGTSQAQASVPAASFIVKVVDPDCQRSGEPVVISYPSVDEAVKDTVPGEWWPPSGYSASMGQWRAQIRRDHHSFQESPTSRTTHCMPRRATRRPTSTGRPASSCRSAVVNGR